MNLFQATFAAIDAFERLQLPYMLSGSLASMYYSFPRATTDADFVLELDAPRLAELAKLLGPVFRVDPQMTFETFTGTIRHGVEVVGTPFIIELFRLSAQPFDRERFARRVQVKLMDRLVCLPTPEDVIIQKLLWNRSKDRDDVIGVIAIQRTRLNETYLQHWCGELGLRDQLRNVWDASAPLPPSASG